MSNRRLIRTLASLAAGSIGVAAGLYFGRFVAAGAGGLLAIGSSAGTTRAAISLATSTAWWAFIGLIAGAGLAFTAVKTRRIQFAVITLVGFALAGALAAWLGSTPTAPLASVALPAGGALAGLLAGLAARLKVGSALMLFVGAAAMTLAGPHIDARGSAIPRPIASWALADWLALLAPGALMGAALGYLIEPTLDSDPG
jgi:hypothetical protein